MGLPLIYRRANPLAFPGGRNPGFDPAHIVAPNCLFSGIASGAKFVSLLQGAPGTASSISAGILGSIGPVITNSSGYISFANQPTGVTSNATIAAIAYLTNSAGTPYLFNSSSAASTGVSIGCQGGTANFGIIYTAVNRISSGIILALNTPYFLAASRIQTTGNFVVVNLLNGKIQSAMVTGGASAPGSSNGTFLVANDLTSAGGPWVGSMSAVMFSSRYSSLQTLLQWAQRPWDFWYPPTVEDLIFRSFNGVSPLSISSQPMIFM